MKKQLKKKVTIEDLSVEIKNLAVMTGKGFKEVDGRFKEVHEKMDNGFKEVDERFNEVHKKMDKGFKDVRAEMDRGFKDVRGEIEDLAVMTGKGFAEVDDKFAEVREKMDKGFIDVNSSMQQVKNRLTVVEDNQLDLKLQVNVLSHNGKGTDELRSRVAVLEKKVGVK